MENNLECHEVLTEIINACFECGRNIGSDNPRQYCGKTHCIDPPKQNEPEKKMSTSTIITRKNKRDLEDDGFVLINHDDVILSDHIIKKRRTQPTVKSPNPCLYG